METTMKHIREIIKKERPVVTMYFYLRSDAEENRIDPDLLEDFYHDPASLSDTARVINYALMDEDAFNNTMARDEDSKVDFAEEFENKDAKILVVVFPLKRR